MNYFVIGMILGIIDSIFMLLVQYNKIFRHWVVKDENEPGIQHWLDVVRTNSVPWWMSIVHVIAVTLVWPLSIIISIIDGIYNAK